jgi:hypothetical protein
MQSVKIIAFIVNLNYLIFNKIITRNIYLPIRVSFYVFAVYLSSVYLSVCLPI